jgi:hypothetical protein
VARSIPSTMNHLDLQWQEKHVGDPVV